MRLVFTVREEANPELYQDLNGRDSRARPERVRYLATLGLLVAQGRIEATERALGELPEGAAATGDNEPTTTGPDSEENATEAGDEEAAHQEEWRGLNIAQRFRTNFGTGGG